MSCNPATIIKLYPVKAIIIFVHAFAICVDFIAIVLATRRRMNAE